MPIELKMPALSPTMEEGTLAKWLVKEGDTVAAGDLLAEIETDKATMEFEAVDEGVVSKIVVPEGSEGVKVGAVIALITEEGEAAGASPKPEPEVADKSVPKGGGETAATPTPEPEVRGYGANPAEDKALAKPQPANDGDRVKASPLARRLAEAKGIDLGSIQGSGPGGRIVKADIDGAGATATPALPREGGGPAAPAPTGLPPAREHVEAGAPKPVWFDETIPHSEAKLSNIRKTIARRLTEAKQTIPHIYLTVDIRLDALLKLRGDLNASLSGRGVKLSVNDLLIKALGVALEAAPKCNVTYRGDTLVSYQRADVSVAVSTPTGLITPIIRDAAGTGVAKISAQMKELAGRAKEGKLQPHEYQGGTASISNMGMYGIKSFDAVINPPQAMIMAIGAGEKRPYIVDDALGVATVMSATGSFDHRAIDGADGAELMKIFKELVESPMGLVA